MDNAEFLEKQKQLIALCPEVDNLVFALREYLGVTFFRYVKSFPNGEKFIISNNADWLKAYFSEKYYNNELADFNKHPDGSKGVHIHHPCNRDNVVCNFWRSQGKKGNYASFCYFFEKYNNYFESYNFGLNGDTHETNDAFFNNQHLYRHFFLYFRSRGKELIERAYALRFNTDDLNEQYDQKQNWLLGINSNLTKIVMQEMPIHEFCLDDEYANVHFTVNEAKSLKLFLEGYSLSYSANELCIDQLKHTNTLSEVMKKLKVDKYDDLRKLCHERNIANKLSFLSKDVK